MKERPILFSSAMILRLLDGSKVQTRRVVKFPGADPDGYPAEPEKAWVDSSYQKPDFGNVACLKMPYGDTTQRIFPRWEAGDLLWVKETFTVGDEHPEMRSKPEPGDKIVYRAGVGSYYGPRNVTVRWRPSIFMPRWASRITLEITEVRCERLGDITTADIQAEGVTTDAMSDLDAAYLTAFQGLWTSINGSYDPATWVFAITFRRIKP